MSNKSSVMKKYHALKKSFKANLADPELSCQLDRLNSALGYAYSKNCAAHLAEYTTTVASCDCPDTKYRPGFVCKHILCAIMVYDGDVSDFRVGDLVANQRESKVTFDSRGAEEKTISAASVAEAILFIALVNRLFWFSSLPSDPVGVAKMAVNVF